MTVAPLFEASYAKLAQKEAGYSNNPNDSGGETNGGITIAVARENGYQGPMKDLPEPIKKDIYRRKYWESLRLDDVCVIAGARVADELFDTNVNLPYGKAATFLQRTLNVMNKRGALYPDIEVDGGIGDQTINALRAYMRQRGGEGAVVLLRALNSQQGEHYIVTAEKYPKNEDFEYGWFANRVV